MENNQDTGLKMLQLKTDVTYFEKQPLEITIEELCEKIKKHTCAESDVVAYLDYRILIGKFNGNTFSFYKDEIFLPKYIQKLRIFNTTEELLIWRSGNNLQGRMRKDEENGDNYAVDANQVLFGTTAQEDNGYTILTEDRGTKITLPGRWETSSGKTRVAIHTRNYVEENNISQMTYVDCRFVEFVQL